MGPRPVPRPPREVPRRGSRAHRVLHGPRAPVGEARRFAAALVAWLEPLQARLLEVALGSRHLKRDAGARPHDPFGRLQIITAEAAHDLPTDKVDEAAARTSRANAADGDRVGRVFGIKMSDTVPHGAIAEFRTANVERIRSLVGEQLADIERLLVAAENEGTHALQLAKQIEERFAVTQSKAELLARDQVLKLNGQLTEARQTASGISRYTWSTSGDERVREMHADLDGTEQAWGDPPVTNDAGDRNPPGGDYQCRCVAVPILDL